jgi:uncharacterized protein (TIGR02444 family)
LTSAWAFAVAAWGQPGVEAICLELQDVHGQLPALLLWRLWTLEANRPVDPESLAAAIRAARDWEAAVLRPLRRIRRRLASGAPIARRHIGDQAWETVRRRVRDAELEAEHALFDALEVLESPTGTSTGEAAASHLEGIMALAGAWRPPAPSSALARLIEAL